MLLLGRSMDGRTPETIMTEAQAYGTEDRVTIKEGLPDDEMVRAIRSARVSLMLSGNEGSCVAVVESMFADVPVGMFHDAIMGSLAYINDQTGRRLYAPNLGAQLSQFVAEHEKYSPRRWVMDNGISCFGSTEMLNTAIRTKALEWGEEWTRDIAVQHWRPNPSFVDEKDNEVMAEAYAEFGDKYGCPILPRATDGSFLEK